MQFHWLAIFWPLVIVKAQRGCPSEGCDPRGLNCQPDFEVGGTEAKVVWTANLGANYSIEEVLGCIGNDANVICKVGDKEKQGFVSVDGQTGKVNWYDTLMQNPRLPIMNMQGDIIATDGHFMEFRLKNGSLGGKPAHFYGYITNCSSIHYVEEPNLFFFVSYASGGMYMYDTSGMCVASTFLNVKDPATNHTVSVWIPVTRLVVNTDFDPPCTYFVARNNVTEIYRMYAVNFNHQPPYISVKWSIDIDVDPSIDQVMVAGSKLIARGKTVLLTMGANMMKTHVISDHGSGGSIDSVLHMHTQSFASFDYPSGSHLENDDPSPILWMASFDEHLQTTVQGWTAGTSGFKYTINLSQRLNTSITAITSEIMAFGYHPEEVTLVFGYTVIAFDHTIEDGDEGLPPGGYIIAIKPQPDGTAEILWNSLIGQRIVIGQIIGHKDNMLLANVLEEDSQAVSLLGIQLQ